MKKLMIISTSRERGCNKKVGSQQERIHQVCALLPTQIRSLILLLPLMTDGPDEARPITKTSGSLGIFFFWKKKKIFPFFLWFVRANTFHTGGMKGEKKKEKKKKSRLLMIVSARVTDFIHHSGQLGLHFLNIPFGQKNIVEGNATDPRKKRRAITSISALLFWLKMGMHTIRRTATNSTRQVPCWDVSTFTGHLVAGIIYLIASQRLKDRYLAKQEFETCVVGWSFKDKFSKILNEIVKKLPPPLCWDWAVDPIIRGENFIVKFTKNFYNFKITGTFWIWYNSNFRMRGN